jgi:glycosyltransferase involved in cell wall biosynthesis
MFPVLALNDLTRDATSHYDLLNRFNLYAKHLSVLSTNNEVKLHLITKKLPTHFDLKASNWPYLEIIQANNSSISYLSTLFRFIHRNKGSISIIIAGSPWRDFLFVLPMKLFFRIPIQVSIHGEPYRGANNSPFSAMALKNIWLRIFLRYADSIRAVSNHQIAPISSRYKVKVSRIFTSPIPVEIPSISPTPKLKNTIAFVGRLHEERDPFLWLQIIHELYTLRQDFSAIVIGDGPLRHQVSDYLQKQLPNLDCSLVGSISHPEVQRYWNRISILLSTAPNESFGLTLREAQLAGVMVIARNNSGTTANSLEFGRSITLFDTSQEAVNAIVQALDNPKDEEDLPKIRLIQQQINLKSLNNLVESWKA